MLPKSAMVSKFLWPRPYSVYDFTYVPFLLRKQFTMKSNSSFINDISRCLDRGQPPVPILPAVQRISHFPGQSSQRRSHSPDSGPTGVRPYVWGRYLNTPSNKLSSMLFLNEGSVSSAPDCTMRRAADNTEYRCLLGAACNSLHMRSYVQLTFFYKRTHMDNYRIVNVIIASIRYAFFSKCTYWKAYTTRFRSSSEVGATQRASSGKTERNPTWSRSRLPAS